MLVALAWLSFIVPPDVVPGRMGLLVTVFLMLITIFIGVRREAPPSNGFVNAADMFVIACISHVFLGFIEYAFVLFGVKKAKMSSATTIYNRRQRWQFSGTTLYLRGRLFGMTI